MRLSFPRLAPTVLLIGLFVGAATITGCLQERGSTTSAGDTDTTETAPGVLSETDVEPDVPFVESPRPVVTKMLEMAQVTEDDIVYDLGSGDGRIVIKAAQEYGARGVGIEIKPELVEKARQNAEASGVSDLAEFRQGDLFEADIGDATVVTLYLLPSVNLELRPKLFRELAPGTRVVSHDFDMSEWEPDTTWESGGETVYRWTIPEETPGWVTMEE